MPLNAAPIGSTSSACLSCRRVKMKCRPSQIALEPRCERCSRKSLECIFQEHRRGRKPGTRIRRTEAAAITMHTPTSPTQTQQEQPRSSNIVASHDTERNQSWQSGNLQPSGLLNHAATHGRFSLESILDPAQPLPANRNEGNSSIPLEDPIQKDYVNLQIAISLFDNFMQCLNPYICQMDPILHTFSYVRQSCSFLLTAILAAAAKVLNPALYAQLQEHSENLFAKNFRLGKKSTEIAQAVLIMTYWKDAEDTRAWISVGYVIRMGMDLGWHKLRPGSYPAQTTELQKRELRNVQRLWYILFVYDRSISLQTGKPWMIERNGFIENIETWCKDSIATRNDGVLAALVTLRLLSSEVFKLLTPKSREIDTSPLHSIESLLSIVKARIEEWEDKWLRFIDKDSCHEFLIRFYGTHLRLQLFSLPLQEILASKDSNISFSLETLWVSYSSALEMLSLLRRFLSQLYFAQDSIHVMTAYSATFLIKLLLSTPHSIVSKIESETCDAIRAAAQSFSQQSSPPASSCSLQARFLAKILSNYTEKQQERRRSNNFTPSRTTNAASNLSSDTALIIDGSTSTDQRQGYTHVPSMELADDNVSFQDSVDFAHVNDEIWSDMFASAGYSIQDGVFFA